MVKEYEGSLNELASRLDIYKRNPTLAQRAALDFLSEITNGEISIVDATNPFVFLLEASAVLTSNAINQADINLRKQYAALAISDEDIFRHLSDKEIIGRFASPVSVDFMFIMTLDNLRKSMTYVREERQSKVIIPKDTYISVDGTIYTLSYPVVIALHDAGGLKVSYDASKPSPIENLTTNNIIPLVKRAPDGTEIVYFSLKLKQVKLEAKEFTIEKKAVFKKNLTFTDKFYYARAWHKGNMTDGKWVEISTTHTDQVYDINSPTVCFKVLDNSVDIYIPHVYVTNGLIGSTVRIDLYTTKGQMTVDYREHEVGSFTTTLRSIDPADESVFTTSAVKAEIQAYSTAAVEGGTDGISFAELRRRTIFHANGANEIPITTAQIESRLGDSGFEIVPNVDTLTSRIFFATRSLPAPSNKKLLSAINMSIGTCVMDTMTFENNPNIRFNANRITLTPENLYENVNGIIALVPYDELRNLFLKDRVEMVSQINARSYLYCPFYYVLDYTGDEYDVRAYDLDSPDIGEINFVSQNETIQMPVNSTSPVLAKVHDGYELYIKTLSSGFYREAADSDVGLQVGFYPPGESFMAYINAELYATNPDDDERVWKIKLHTNLDLNKDDHLSILNAKMFVDEEMLTAITLDTTLHLFHYTTSVTTIYTPDEADTLLGKFLLPAGARTITHETLPLKLGYSLKNLWKRAKGIPVDQQYILHEVDVPMTYDIDIYETDENGIKMNVVNGVIEYQILHRKGDPVLRDGEPVMLHKKGDVMFDPNGKPMFANSLRQVYELDMLFFDGVMYFVNDEAILNYRSQANQIIRDWITDDLAEIDKILLDRTRIYLYPKSMLGKVEVRVTNESSALIDAQQSLTLDLYVSRDIYDDQNVRDLIRQTSIKVLDRHISGTEINTVNIIEDLRSEYDQGVISFRLSGLGGPNRNYSVISVVNKEKRLCINKRLVSQPDGTLLVEDDVTINFIRY